MSRRGSGGVVLCVNGWRRPEYFRKVLEALEDCAGLRSLRRICFVLDGSDGGRYDEERDAMTEHVQRFRARRIRPESMLMRLGENHGCAGAVGHSVRLAFQNLKADAAIFLEDDTVPTPDFLVYMLHMLDLGKNVPSVFTVSGYARPEAPASPSDLNAGRRSQDPQLCYYLRDHFTSWGWATWRDRMQEGLSGWFGAFETEGANRAGLRGEPWRRKVREDLKGSWAWPMNKYWRQDRVEVAPSVSRIQNIGARGGQFCPETPGWHRAHQHTDNIIGDGVPPAEAGQSWQFIE